MIPICHLFHINAPRMDVFKALTSQEGLSAWYTTIENGNAKGGEELTFLYGSMHLKARVKVYIPGESLEWECVEASIPMVGHSFRFELDENDGKTRVRFTHIGFEAQDDSYANMNYSWAKYLESLRQYCQTGIGEAFGSENYRI
jgi:uncharacterized protein YndB with AHSA1/START domain